jgi:hypothetical protein
VSNRFALSSIGEYKESMRFVWAFAIACVVAATSVCPEIDTRDRSQAAELQKAPTTPHILAARGHEARTNAVRLAPFSVPAALALDIEPREVVARATAPHAPPYSVTEVPRSARGPPIA